MDTARNIKAESGTETQTGTRRGVKREADPELDEILSSARSAKVPRRDEDIEVIDLSDD